MPEPAEQCAEFQRVLVTGAGGQLGRELVRSLGPRAAPLTRADCDLTDDARLREAVLRRRPDLIVNCAAYTAVDNAESDEQACFAANAEAVEVLAGLANELSAKLVQISTDYVFGADQARRKPYCETDEPGPVNVYGRSKLAGEAAAAAAKSHLIVRTCGLYSASPEGPVRGRNFCDTMLALAREGRPLRVVDDQHCTPTYVPDFAAMLLQLIGAGATGVFHATAAGETTWHGLAERLFEVANLPVPLAAIPTQEYPTPAGRPGYSVLDCGKRDAICLSPRTSWEDQAVSYLVRCDLL